MRRAIIAATISISGAASAGKVLVLKSDGNADAATKAKVEAEVITLARALPGTQVEIGDVTFTDAAVAVGCTGSEAQCRDDVIATMGVEEVVSITTASLPSGDTRIVVDRLAKGTPTKVGQATVPAGQSIETKLETELGPSFGVKPAEPPPSPPPPPVTTTTTPPPPSTTLAQPAFGDSGPTTTSAPPGPPMNEAPPLAEPSEAPSQRGPVIGLAVGGGLVVLSLIMWGEASSTQGDIDTAPTKTVGDFHNLQNLENQGAAYATLGNVFFVGGIVTAAVSSYFFWRNRTAHANATATQAMVTPTLFDHGAGLALTIGGLR
ncbi:MAG TPA: hypothetical protein VGG74_01705 [Kofleriaceae bacterium]|jgi:hypothetical protein